MNLLLFRAYKVVKQIALSRKLHSGYQFIAVQDMELAVKILPQTVKLPTLFIWEHHTGFYYLYEVIPTQLNNYWVCRLLIQKKM